METEIREDLEIKYVATSDLLPYARNARTHSDLQINQIASSIKEFGFNNPILIDKNNQIIAGHGRLLACDKIGIKEVPIRRQRAEVRLQIVL